jgi:hypothetical protein
MGNLKTYRDRLDAAFGQASTKSPTSWKSGTTSKCGCGLRQYADECARSWASTHPKCSLRTRGIEPLKPESDDPDNLS